MDTTTTINELSFTLTGRGVLADDGSGEAEGVITRIAGPVSKWGGPHVAEQDLKQAITLALLGLDSDIYRFTSELIEGGVTRYRVFHGDKELCQYSVWIGVGGTLMIQFDDIASRRAVDAALKNGTYPELQDDGHSEVALIDKEIKARIAWRDRMLEIASAQATEANASGEAKQKSKTGVWTDSEGYTVIRGKLIDINREYLPSSGSALAVEDGLPILAQRLEPPTTRILPAEELFGTAEVLTVLNDVRQQLNEQHGQTIGRFDMLDISAQHILSKVDDAFTSLMQALIDEAKDGPRLFSLVPVDRTAFNPKQWTSEKFRLTLWCEHSRLPLPAINGKDSKAGVYELELTRTWFKKAAPFLKVLTGTLSLVLPVASSTIKLALDDTTYKQIEEQLDFGQKSIEAVMEGSEKVGGWLGKGEASDLEHGAEIRAEGSVLRELHALLKEKDPGFGGLVRMQNKRQEFLWVHERYASEY